MRKIFAFVLAGTVAITGLPVSVAAASGPAARRAQQPGTLQGVAQAADKAPLPNYTVRVRNVQTGDLAGSTTTNEAGEFSFAGLTPASYVVEIVDAAGQIVGLSPTITVSTGTVASVTVTVSAAATEAIATGGGFSFLGLGTAASAAVIAGAATIGVGVAVASTKKPASGSR
jgi:hypothetical protein